MAETVRFNLVIPYRFQAAKDQYLRDVEARKKQAAVAAKLPPICGDCGARIPGAIASGIVPIVRSYDEVLRDTSQTFVEMAARDVYGDTMNKTEQGIWRRISIQIALDDVHVLAMDGTAYEWLLALMRSDKVKVHTGDVDNYATFLEALEHAERIPAPAVVEPAAETGQRGRWTSS